MLPSTLTLHFLEPARATTNKTVINSNGTMFIQITFEIPKRLKRLATFVEAKEETNNVTHQFLNLCFEESSGFEPDLGGQ